MSVRREFMIADNDNSNSIDINEFLKFCNDFKISLNNDEVNLLFNSFDTNKKGKLDYKEKKEKKIADKFLILLVEIIMI